MKGLLAFNQDLLAITGTLPAPTVNTSARLSGFQQTSGSDLDKFKQEIYIEKSGTYLVKMIATKDANSPKVDVGLDSSTNNLFSQTDLYNGSASFNNTFFTTIQVARGSHELVHLVNGKNASSGGYNIHLTGIFFELIEEHSVAGEEGIAQTNQGSMVLLAKYRAPKAESSVTFNLADVKVTGVDAQEKYSKIIIEIDGNATASLALQAKLNGATSGYHQDGYTSIAGTLAVKDLNAQAQFEIAGTAIITGGDRIRGKAEISLIQDTYELMMETLGYCNQVGVENLQGICVTAEPLTSIEIKTSTSTWTVGTRISVYGVKRQ